MDNPTKAAAPDVKAKLKKDGYPDAITHWSRLRNSR